MDPHAQPARNLEPLERRLLLAILSPLYVSPDGSDTSTTGSLSAPFKTLSKARDFVRANKGLLSNDITVYLRGGQYPITETVTFGPADSGNNGYRIIYAAYPESDPNNVPRLSGGRPVTPWTPVPGRPPGLISASVSSDTFREFYVSDVWQQRARTEERLIGKRWWLDASGKPAGIVIDAADLPQSFTNVPDMEIHLQWDWRDTYIPITDITPAAGGERVIRLNTDALSTALGLTNTFMFNAPFYVENARELIDQPGEWYCDRPADRLYYLSPTPPADLTRFPAVIPVTTTLISMAGSGTSGDDLVSGLWFSGLTFEHAANTAPNYVGWLGYQSSTYERGALSPAVGITRASDISFIGNRFTRLGGVGIDVHEYSNNIDVVGNAFVDLGDTAVNVGRRPHASTNAVAGADINVSTVIQNNLIYRIGRSFYGACGITLYGTINSRIEHNHIQDVPYSGMQVGWSYGEGNRIANNRIVGTLNILRDGGSIYTFGPSGLPGQRLVITGNYVSEAHGDFGGIYLDETPTYIDVFSNVVADTANWLNINKNANSINVSDTFSTTTTKSISTNNVSGLSIQEPIPLTTPPQPAAQAIISRAGLQPRYARLLDLLPHGTNTPPTATATIVGSATVALTGSVTVAGSASDDQLPFSFLRTRWSQTAGPTGGWATFRDPRQRSTRVEFSLPGTYTLRFEADDGRSTSASTVTVVVSPVTLPVNLALSATFSASSQFSPTFAPARAGDNNINTSWSTAQNTPEGRTFLQADLGSPNRLSRIELTHRQDVDQPASRRRFMVIASNDPSFSSFASYEVLGSWGGDGAESMPFRSTWTANLSTQNAYRYVRLTGLKDETFVIAELRLFGGTQAGQLILTPLQDLSPAGTRGVSRNGVERGGASAFSALVVAPEAMQQLVLVGTPGRPQSSVATLVRSDVAELRRSFRPDLDTSLFADLATASPVPADRYRSRLIQ